jgi:geranylgeranyl diphosphate synthase, type I
MDYFLKQKPSIELTLKKFIDEFRCDYHRVNAWGDDICSRLLSFASHGKMIRGGLVLLGHDLCGGSRKNDALKCAAVMELFQSGFLIHDDIMDRDSIRRGNPSIFYQYKEKGDAMSFQDSYHFGESVGICAGDIVFFMGYDILSTLDLPADLLREIIKKCSREISYVGLAQIQDVYFGYLSEAPSTDEILSLYLHKTGRYTFSLPLMVGALLSGKSQGEVKQLAKLGEKLGLIFQIKDDELGLFGNSDEIGKVVGSDIKENKKSLYHHFLFTRSKGSDRKKLEKIFGSDDVTGSDIDTVREAVISLGIPEIINDLVDMIATEARTILANLSQSHDSEALAVLHQLLDYSLTRKK